MGLASTDDTPQSWAIRDEPLTIAARTLLGADEKVGDLSITDHRFTDRYDIYIVATPADARLSMLWVARGGLHALLARPEVHLLSLAAHALRAHAALVSEGALLLHASHPQLSDRSIAILREVVRGSSNSEIARRTHLSLSSVKREMTDLTAKLGGADRRDLVQRGLGLGYPP